MIWMYSSGSVLAQQLLFGSIPAGDVTRYISVFFDTRVGAKTDAESYRKIGASFSEEPKRFLFISDSSKETEVAQLEGMQAMLCECGPDAPGTPGPKQVIHDF